VSRICFLLILLGACTAEKIDASMGARCVGAADCVYRCLPAGAQFPGGLCTRDCLVDADCPSDALCVPIEGQVCLYSCRDDGDCDFLGEVNGQRWTCQDENTGSGTAKVCLGPGQ
jgi:hypothetical protein